MLFSSIEFLFLFLPVVLAGYYVLPFRFGLKNAWLLAASLFFYAWGEPRFVFVMVASIVFNYFAALGLEALRTRGGALSVRRRSLSESALRRLSWSAMSCSSRSSC